MASNLTQYDFALKERYDSAQRVENLVQKGHPTLTKLRKDTNFMGDGHPVPLIYGNPQGIAGSRVVSQTNATNVAGKKFIVTAGDLSGTVDIGDKVMKASRANPGAFLANKAAEIDGLHATMGNTLSQLLWSNGGFALGGTTGNVTTTTVTLSDASAIRQFEEDMVLTASLADGTTGALLGSPVDTATIVSVNANAGTFVIDALPASWNAAGPLFFFREDVYGMVNSVFAGIPAYIWHNDSPGTLYSMTNRTDNPQRLAGGRVPAANVAGMGIQERIQRLGTYAVGRWRSKAYEYYALHPEDWERLAISLQSQGQRPLKDDSTRFGYRYLSVISGAVEAEVYSDGDVPKGNIFGLNLEHWKMMSMEELVHRISGDGLTLLRKGTSNDYEYRIQSYPGLFCNAPGFNGRVPTA